MKIRKGFTLIELLIVMSILGILVTVAIVSFRSSQIRGRDAQRKSDLKQISNALELFYSDYSKYPSEVGGVIQACIYNSATGSGGSCTWGNDEFSDGKTIYLKNMPKDPSEDYTYYYRIVDSPQNQKFQLFAYLENTEDPSCIEDSCTSPPVTIDCGGKICNFAITSANTEATE